MSRECSKHGENRMQLGFWLKSQKERDHYNDLDVDGRKILKWILDRIGAVWPRLIWLRIGTSGGLL
jgi:hypothetical protein